MKKNHLLASLFAFLCLTVASPATVLVFKGSAVRYKGNGTSSDKVSTAVYFVIQYDATGGTQGANYFVFTSPGKKTVSLNGPRNFGFVQTGAGATKVNFYVESTGSFNTVFNFSSTYVRFQGAPGAVQPLASSPATVTFIKSLTGTFSDLDSSPLAFEFPSLTLSFDKVRTQAANALGKSAAALATDIANEFLAKPGYTMGS